MCADTDTASAGAACCGSDKVAYCMHNMEKVTFATAAARCTAASSAVCDQDLKNIKGDDSGAIMCDDVQTYKDEVPSQFGWTTTGCNVQAQVYADGLVQLVHTGTSDARLKEISGNTFAVTWDNGRFPTPDDSCAGAPRCKHAVAPGRASW